MFVLKVAYECGGGRAHGVRVGGGEARQGKALRSAQLRPLDKYLLHNWNTD